MINYIKKAVFLAALLFLGAKNIIAWDNEITHVDLTTIASEKSILGTDNYLAKLGLRDNLDEKITWNGLTLKIKEWFAEGGNHEDDGDLIYDAPFGKARFNNHFHHPLKPWASAGLNDVQTGESSLLWAQDGTKQAVAVGGGDWSWSHIRGFYLRALTSAANAERQAYFAQTFRGLGQQMHLIQDAAVPAHVRNDAHPLDATMHYHAEFVGQYFESWAKENRSTINSFAMNTISPTVSFDISRNDHTLGKDLVPITQLIDTDQYAGINPSASVSIGLAEYANANFFSDDTIFAAETFAADQKHFSPFPRQNSTNLQNLIDQSLLPEVVIAFDGKPDKGFWIEKVRDGEGEGDKHISHFVKPTYLSKKLFGVVGISQIYLRSFYLDEQCHNDYAALLVPRAVGYSAALINYFFRGQIDLELDEDDPTQYVISNDSDESLHGIFSLYYDDKTGTRRLLKTSLISAGVSTIEAHTTSDPVSFDEPENAQSPGNYILVFQGTMGEEVGAIAARVVKFNNVLAITPPDSYMYSMVDASGYPAQFTTIKAKVGNADAAKQIQAGTLDAIAKYKKAVDDENFIYSVSTPQTISALTTTTEFTFDFKLSPIPVNVTDLYLQVIFKGKMGSDDNAVAIGLRDISEPTPIDLFNNKDRVCINSTWYVAGSAEAIAQVDTSPQNGIANEWDVYPVALRDIYIKISSPEDPQQASPEDYDFHVPGLPRGTFKRAMYILTEPRFSYGFYNTYTKLMSTDPWTHEDTQYIYPGTAVKNQTELVDDPNLCGNHPPCPYPYYSEYYSYRGHEIWWGGGLIYIIKPYPEGSSCED